MQKGKDKQKDFEVQAKLELLVSVTVSAKNLDEAIEKSKGFRETDFVDILGDYMDGNFYISGVYESNP
jgi:adenosine deaminase